MELKAVKALDEVHRPRCLNYLRSSGERLCLLFNFGTPRLEIKRIVNGSDGRVGVREVVGVYSVGAGLTKG